MCLSAHQHGHLSLADNESVWHKRPVKYSPVRWKVRQLVWIVSAGLFVLITVTSLPFVFDLWFSAFLRQCFICATQRVAAHFARLISSASAT